MITALLLALTLSGEPSAHWTVRPVSAQIGEPVECRLEIRAPAGSAVLLDEKDPPLDPSWLLLEPRRVERRETAGELAIDLSWKLCSLESGARVPFTLVVPVETGSGRTTLEPGGAQISVLAALAEGEDAPRPLKGFLPAPADEASRLWIVWAGLGVVLAAACALFLRRAPRKPPAIAGPLDRLAELERAFAAEEARGRETVFALTHLVRERTDARLQSPRAALPDEEWIRLVATDPRLPDSVRTAARRLLERADAVKYAQATPSRFLVEELCADARAALATEERAA
jgi:hypothetical protein